MGISDGTEFRYGGLVGAAWADKIEIKNCTNYANIQAYYLAGGIIGQTTGDNDNIINCNNYGNISAEPSNDGVWQVGGICGEYQADAGNIKGCHNYGEINCVMKEGKRGGEIAGVIGERTYGIGIIENCSNFGNVTIVGGESEHVGGIAGDCDEQVKNCYNQGNIIAKGATEVGGIIGYSYYYEGTSDYNNELLVSSYNTGKVIGKEYVGGCVGMMGIYNSRKNIEVDVTYKNCYNTGAVEGTNYVGGIVGQCGNYSTESYEGNDYIQSASGLLKNCYNVGTVTGQSNVGALAGILIKKANSKIVNSYYLSGTANVAYYTDEEPSTSSEAEAKTTEEMTKTEFVDVLNANNEINYKEDKASINKKYPILNWQ